MDVTVGGIGKAGRDYAQDKVRPGTGREGALGYVLYIAKSTWMCGAIAQMWHNT